MESIVGLFIFCSLAAVEDYQRKKISNLLIIFALISAVLYQFRQDGIQGILYSFLQICIILFLFFPLYLLKKLGAGDIKLLGVTAVYLSWKKTLIVFIVGLYLSIIIIALRFLQKKNIKRDKIPMAGAILGGILYVLCKEGIF